jgi:hypothetical protein
MKPLLCAALVASMAASVASTAGHGSIVHAQDRGPTSVQLPPVPAGLRLPYRISDSASVPGAWCTYDGGHPRRRVFVPVRMPRIYWPNRHPGRAEHGTVGWQIRLQLAPDSNGPWRTVYRSSITTGRATETRAADVFKLGINWHITSNVVWRVRSRMIWYRPNGSHLASVVRTVRWYRLSRALSPWSPHSVGSWNIGRTLGTRHGGCPNYLSR